MNIFKVIPSKFKRTIPKNEFISKKSNLINEIYYDTEWWNRKFALEWWERNGHFNEELYSNILLAKLNKFDELQSTKNKLNR